MPLATNGKKTPGSCSIATPGQCKQSLSSTPQSPTDQLQLLRRFLDQLGTVLSEEIKWSKEVIDKYLKDGALKHCQENSDLISKFEYGGSLYENLKIQGADEGDANIHVVLKVKKSFVTFDVKEDGYALIKAVEGSPYKEYSNEEGLLMPKKFKVWLFKLVTSAVPDISSKASSVSFKVSSCSAGVKVTISESSKSLEVQLMPAFQHSSDEFFIAAPQHGYLPGKEWKGLVLAERVSVRYPEGTHPYPRVGTPPPSHKPYR